MNELKDLIGIHTLSGVEKGYIKDKDYYGAYEDCNCLSFILDGIQYTAIEDPQDGYRSCMKTLKTEKKIKIKNIFPDVKVFCFMKDDRDSDVLIFYAVKGAMKILEVGTENKGDYYPYFVDNFYPENMPVNRRRRSA